MGELYDRMALDLKLKNLAPGTQSEYLRCCCSFVRYHMKSPRELGETAIKQYLGHLQLTGASPEKLKMHIAGLKFLYGVTLDRPKVAERLPWPKVPHKKPKRSRLWLNDGSCIRLRPEYLGHVWSYDFAELFVIFGPLAHLRSDNGPEYIAMLCTNAWRRSA